jgi:drug/metabolite transporter (DMT)-like permease
VVQLQVPFAMMMAVVMLREQFTVLQAIGSALMMGGSFITQGNAGKRKNVSAPLLAASDTTPKPTFQPRVVLGYLFGLAAALCYGSSPLMARQALLQAPGASTVAGGCAPRHL